MGRNVPFWGEMCYQMQFPKILPFFRKTFFDCTLFAIPWIYCLFVSSRIHFTLSKININMFLIGPLLDASGITYTPVQCLRLQSLVRDAVLEEIFKAITPKAFLTPTPQKPSQVIDMSVSEDDDSPNNDTPNNDTANDDNPSDDNLNDDNSNVDDPNHDNSNDVNSNDDNNDNNDVQGALD